MSGGARTAIIAGQGRLPALLAAAFPDAQVWALEGFAPGVPSQPFRLERLVPFLDALVDGGVRRAVFAGAVQRPRLEPELFDARTAALVPRILMAMQSGDDAALREVIALFEEWGIEVVAPDSLLPALSPEAGLLAGQPSAADTADADRGAEILAATGALDIGQGCVIVGGLCLAIETLPGTAAMLEFAAAHAALRRGGARGVLVKAPKAGQDRRVDLPAIGPDTVAQAARAALAGIAWPAGGLMVLDREQTVAAAQDAGLFLWAR